MIEGLSVWQIQGKGKKGKDNGYIFDFKSDRFAKELEDAVNVSHCSLVVLCQCSPQLAPS